MPIVLLDGGILVSGNAIASSTECCCVQEEPCSVTINGTRVGLGQIDFTNALDIACWGGSIYPGRLALIQNGATQYDFVLSEWNWFVSTQQLHAPGDPGLDSTETKAFSAQNMLRPDESGAYTDANGVEWELNSNVQGTNLQLDIHTKQISETSCILYGHVGVEYGTMPYTSEYVYTAETIVQVYNYSQTWRWQATITSGTVGAVSYTPVIGSKNSYTGVIFNDGSYENLISTAGPFGPTPVVTITV